MITADQSMFYQQNDKKRTIALVVLSTPNWKLIQAAYQRILVAVEASTPNSYQYIEI